MKRTFLRRRSKNPRKRLLELADTVLQDYYRREFGDRKCEGCGKPMELMHHYVLKCHSNYLRYNHPENLIFICKKCHSQVHGFHGELINAQIILKRGQSWLDKLRKLERIKIDLGMNKLREIIDNYVHN